MTLQKSAHPRDRHPVRPYRTPRLRLKPKALSTGRVDGAWWPRSDDLTAELPDLLAVLSVRLGAIARVAFGLNEWAKAPAKLVTDGGLVRLDGFRIQPVHTVEVLGVNGAKIVLLVVPLYTDPDYAHATLMAAAAPNDDTSIDGLLTIGS